MSTYTDPEHFVEEVMWNKNMGTYWTACNRPLAEQTYERVKKMISEAKYYEFDGVQFITVYKMQEKTLLLYFETLQDMYERKICEINDMRCQIVEVGI